MADRKGFTLIEILLVLAVLALIIPGFMAVAAHTANMNNGARLRSGATFLAQGILEDLVANNGALPLSGESPPYTWSAKDISAADIPPGLQTIDVVVNWRYGKRDQEVRLSTYRRLVP